ncbi:hypothetical protein QFC24_004180 [Naganishia onofrii]|uniref:Uncharacterized protein n=1 Tax=Naganishia onofrii TaxID=1851511 RepID=A0ACC2XGI6_9TREE|nr:hypothetical protein QFC24_004180 [Naganishia onofrii]
MVATVDTVNTRSAPRPDSRLLKTVKLGAGSEHEKELHRVAMAPLTRFRNTPGTQAPTDLAVTYYQQRASPKGLIINEATFVSAEAGGYPTAPGIHSEEQVTAWKKVTDAVHAKGGYIYLQAWALGRANAGQDKGVETVAPSPIGLKDHPVPREMTTEDIDAFVKAYGTAAVNAKKAGFDGIELHGANGYLVNQFLESVSNKRTDAYGGDWQGRSKFMFRVLDELINVFGQERIGVRLSPWGRFQDQLEEDPFATYIPVVQEIVKRYPKFGYVHFVEPRNWTGMPETKYPKEGIVESNDPLRAIIRGVDISSYSSPSDYAKTNPSFEDPTPERPTVILSAAGHDAENIEEFVERTGDVAAIGRYFIANPDLPERIFKGYPVRKYDRSTFYSPGPVGYIDQPTWEEESSAKHVENAAVQP